MTKDQDIAAEIRRLLVFAAHIREQQGGGLDDFLELHRGIIAAYDSDDEDDLTNVFLDGMNYSETMARILRRKKTRL